MTTASADETPPHPAAAEPEAPPTGPVQEPQAKPTDHPQKKWAPWALAGAAVLGLGAAASTGKDNPEKNERKWGFARVASVGLLATASAALTAWAAHLLGWINLSHLPGLARR